MSTHKIISPAAKVNADRAQKAPANSAPINKSFVRPVVQGPTKAPTTPAAITSDIALALKFSGATSVAANLYC